MLIPARTGAASVARNDLTSWALRIPAETWLLAGVTIVGAVLRFTTLASQSYWFDEAQAAHELHLSFGAMLHLWSANEPNPPLYFVLAWPWAKLFGTGEAGLRSLSALLGTAVIPITYLCGRELVSRRAGLLAATFAALSPFMIWYSQEAREYMLTAALAGASVLFFARVWHRPSRRNLVWWAVFSALALLTQYFVVFLVAAEAIGLLYRVRDRACLLAVGAMVVVEATLIPHLVAHASHPASWIDGFPLSIRVQQVPVTFGLGTLYQSSFVSYGLLGAAGLAGCVIVLLVIGADRAQLRGAGLAAALAAAVLLVPLVLAELGHDYYEARAMMPAWIPLAVVLGAACTAPRARAAGGALAVVLLAAFVYAGIRIDASAQYQRPNWRRRRRRSGYVRRPTRDRRLRRRVRHRSAGDLSARGVLERNRSGSAAGQRAGDRRRARHRRQYGATAREAPARGHEVDQLARRRRLPRRSLLARPAVASDTSRDRRARDGAARSCPARTGRAGRAPVLGDRGAVRPGPPLLRISFSR